MNIFRELNKVNLQTSDWGEICLLYPNIKDGDSRGVFKLLEGTLWIDYIYPISLMAYEQAAYGFGSPLMNELGAAPNLFVKKLTSDGFKCKNLLNKSCLLAEEHCFPNPKVPDCFEPDIEGADRSLLITQIVIAWKHNRYTVIIREDT